MVVVLRVLVVSLYLVFWNRCSCFLLVYVCFVALCGRVSNLYLVFWTTKRQIPARRPPGVDEQSNSGEQDV